MEFYEKYKSQTEADYLVLNPAKDKDGNLIIDDRIVLPNADFALCEVIVILKNEIKKLRLNG